MAELLAEKKRLQSMLNTARIMGDLRAESDIRPLLEEVEYWLEVAEGGVKNGRK